MELKKARALTKATINVADDISMINAQSLVDLSPEDVFAFSVILCDNDIDRDYDQFAVTCLEGLVPLFRGKAGIFNHSWDAKDQIARIYSVILADGDGNNIVGEQKKQLLAWAYIPRNEYTADVIAKIESGILREVSVGVSVESISCSICGSSMGYAMCEEDHIKGHEYDGALCYGILDNPIDAYEFSFVAVPAQRDAGVRKTHQADAEKALGIVLTLDLSEYPDELVKLRSVVMAAEQSSEDKLTRQEILANNQKYLES